MVWSQEGEYGSENVDDYGEHGVVMATREVQHENAPAAAGEVRWVRGTGWLIGRGTSRWKEERWRQSL